MTSNHTTEPSEEDRDEYTSDNLLAGHFDFLDAKADQWMAELSVQAMANAMASVFEKYASQEIMDRFREKLAGMMHQCFVEGALRAWLDISDQGGLVRIIKPDNDAISPSPDDRMGEATDIARTVEIAAQQLEWASGQSSEIVRQNTIDGTARNLRDLAGYLATTRLAASREDGYRRGYQMAIEDAAKAGARACHTGDTARRVENAIRKLSPDAPVLQPDAFLPDGEINPKYLAPVSGDIPPGFVSLDAFLDRVTSEDIREKVRHAIWSETGCSDDLVQMGMARDDAVAQLAEARGALEATKAVIEGGGGRIGLAKKGLRIVCVHGVPELEDCIGCYDEALMAALALTAEQGEERGDGRG